MTRTRLGPGRGETDFCHSWGLKVVMYEKMAVVIQNKNSEGVRSGGGGRRAYFNV